MSKPDIKYNTQRVIDSGDNPKYEIATTQILVGFPPKPAGLKIVIEAIEICKHCKHWNKHVVYSSDVVGIKETVDFQWALDYLNNWIKEGEDR